MEEILSRSQHGKRASVDIAHIVAETLELVRGSIPVGISLGTNGTDRATARIGYDLSAQPTERTE